MAHHICVFCEQIGKIHLQSQLSGTIAGVEVPVASLIAVMFNPGSSGVMLAIDSCLFPRLSSLGRQKTLKTPDVRKRILS